MSKKLIALIAVLAMILSAVPAFPVSADPEADLIGTGSLILDTDPAGGYEGDYVVIYNPSTSAYTSYSTGNMTGLIETEADPYASVVGCDAVSDEPVRVDVDGLIARIDAERPKVDPPTAEKTSYNVGDIRTFTISNYSPGSSNLSFKCVAKGDHCYVWTPSQNVTNYYPLDVIDPTYPQLICDEFESNYALMNSSFGDHSNGSNGDGRVHLMFYNIDDGFQPGVSNSYVAGYFSSYDFSTNGLPMIHVDTYPCIYYVNTSGDVILRPENSFSVFCHEYQHLINYSQTGGMDSWLNECMSAAAEEICYPGSSVIPRIQSWENYYYSTNDDWLDPPHEFAYTPAYELHNGYSMYDWSNYLDYVLPLYSQVSLFSQYLFTHYGNPIFKTITQQYTVTDNCVSAIANATGANTPELVKNFRIALVANDYAAFDGEYGFVPQNGYDPEEYHNVANPYDLLAPVIFTGSSCTISGGGAITVKPIGGVYNPPSNASSSLVYIGVTRNLNTEPVSLEGIELSVDNATAYVGHTVSLSVIRTPYNANDYTVTWTSTNPAVATVTGSTRSAVVTGVSTGRTTIICRATDNITNNTYSAFASVNVLDFPTLDEALNVPGGTLHFTTSSGYPWEVNIDSSGRAYANSTNVGADSSSSSVQTTIQMQAGETISFEWSVSSESGYDKLKFYVNNTEQSGNISGNVPFTAVTYTAPSTGSYTFKWSYEKDYSVNSGSDMGYLDNVSYSGDPGVGFLAGDVDMDGDVDSADALMILRYAMGVISLTDEQILRAEVDGDGNITSADAIYVLRIALGIIG
ncbi:MAG: Ig-like domain-containing protein [Clostridia bacterium]|nr:Ig-like domain-containing protein [Clostridia bacterium]